MDIELIKLLVDDVAEYYTTHFDTGFCKAEIQRYFKEFIIFTENKEPECLKRVSELQFLDTYDKLNLLRNNLTNKEWHTLLKELLLKEHCIYFNVDEYTSKCLKISMMRSI